MVKYFLDKDGAKTRRIANKAGSGHFEIARMTLGPLVKDSDLYASMFRHRYIRVVELPGEIMVDAPKGLTRRQREALRDASIGAPGEPRKRITVNDRNFAESRDPRGSSTAKAMIGEAV